MRKPIRVAITGLEPGTHVLGARAQHYVCAVHRLRVGDELWLFDPESGREGRGTLLEVTKTAARVTVPQVGRAERRGLAWLHLVQALGKGQKPEHVVREATTLGVGAITLVQTERSVPKASAAPARRERLARVAAEAARQSLRGDVPQINGPHRWVEHVDNAPVPEVEERVRWICVPDANAEPLLSRLECLRPRAEAAAVPLVPAVELWVGPEGGFSPQELQTLLRCGGECVRLGPLVMRTETAAAASLAVVAAWADAHGLWPLERLPAQS